MRPANLHARSTIALGIYVTAQVTLSKATASRAPGAPTRIINLSMHHRDAASVLPVPVGARIRFDSPRAIAGHPCPCATVGTANTALNHSAVIA